MGGSSFTNKIKIDSGPAAVQLSCVALLESGSPQSSIITHAEESMERAGAAFAY